MQIEYKKNNHARHPKICCIFTDKNFSFLACNFRCPYLGPPVLNRDSAITGLLVGLENYFFIFLAQGPGCTDNENMKVFYFLSLFRPGA